MEAPTTDSPLSPEVCEVVASTAPLLREQGTAITTRFYELLFQRHPHVQAMFGDRVDQQAVRLAQAVLAYAEHITNPEVLLPVIERIAARHVAAGVEPVQYPIVGDTLLAAMVDVLGEVDAVVIDAWGAAYDWLANQFVQVESGLRATAGAAE